MTPAELCEDVAVELDAMEATVPELVALQADVAERDPTVREQTAAASFYGSVLQRGGEHPQTPQPLS